jgi:uncharacterized protein YdhG (YjbR/CyaY superfamily)
VATDRDDPAAVEAYLAALPDDDVRRALTDLRARIRAVVPDATERIAYQVPAFFQAGPLVSYAAMTHHCSLLVQSPPLVARLAPQLTGVKVKGATLHFQPDEPLPDGVVELVVRERLAENLARKR